MNLQDTITEALNLTAELQARAQAGQLSDCQQLVLARGAAIEAIEAVYKAASAAEIAAAGSLLDALRAADRDLQQTGQEALAKASADWSRSFGQTPAPRHEYDRAPDLACLDRKA